MPKTEWTKLRAYPIPTGLLKPKGNVLAVRVCDFGFDGGICKHARIGLGAVAPAPVRATAAESALEGKFLNEEVLVQAAEAAVAKARPLSMNAYKVEIVKALVRRSLLE